MLSKSESSSPSLPEWSGGIIQAVTVRQGDARNPQVPSWGLWSSPSWASMIPPLCDSDLYVLSSWG